MNVLNVFKIIIDYIWDVITIPINIGGYNISLFAIWCYVALACALLSFLGIFASTSKISIFYDKSESYAKPMKSYDSRRMLHK